MDTFKIKLIACIIMLIDHVGAVFFPEQFYLRLIGRLAFPIFAFLVARGYSYTKDIKKYMLRLFIFAIISQGPFYLAFNEISNGIGLNIFFTLLFGVFSIYFYEKQPNIKGISFAIGISLIAQILDTDYGFYGVLTIFLFYLFKESKLKTLISMVFLNGIYMLYIFSFILSNNITTSLFNVRVFNQCFSIFSLILIFMYNGKKGRNLKWAFYVFYPLHLTIIYLIYTYM